MAQAPTLLIIAGSDSGGGAGIQADLKTASALGVFATTAVTAITAQNTVGVQAVSAVAPDMVAAQINSVLTDIGADAIKIGMLADATVIEAVARALAAYAGPVVLDPVMVAKSGDPLLEDSAVAALRSRLVPRATVLTPNLPEAARLLDAAAASEPDDIEKQGHALMALGPRAVLMKGGHASGEICTDLLVQAAGTRRFSAPRVATRNTHGTGCSMSSAVASELAKGAPIESAVERAHSWLHAAIVASDKLNIGAGHGPVHHFHEIWS
ncbi:MAG: bifunctional hydroxymethylpyrimidine kinase/phosphomethylpyrimidine kinase [Pseudomonadota bacterium]